MDSASIEIDSRASDPLHTLPAHATGIGLLLASLLIYFLMVALFKSWLTPLVILSAVPFGLIGVIGIDHGAFVLALVERQATESAMRFAAAAAGLKCSRFGGSTAAPSRAEVEALLTLA